MTVTDATNANSSATVSLTIGDFTLSQPSPVTLIQGGPSSTFTLTINTATGLTGTVALMTSALPTGVTVSFAPSTVTLSGSSTVTVSAPSAATNSGGNPYQILLMATYNTQGVALVHSVPLQMTVNPAPSFTLSSATPIPVTLQPGDSKSFSQTIVSQNGFTNSVNLSPGTVYYTNSQNELASAAPYVSVSYNTTQFHMGDSVIGTISAVNNLPSSLLNVPYLVQYTLTGTQTYPGGNYPPASANPMVSAVVGTIPSFSLTGPTTMQNLYAGGTGTPITVTVSPISGQTPPSSLSFSVANCGANIPSCNISTSSSATRPPNLPENVSWTATITVQATTSASAGPYAINVAAVANGQTVYLPLFVNVQPGVTITSTTSPLVIDVMVGGSSSVGGNVTWLNGSAGTVYVYASNLPAGVTSNCVSVPWSSGGTSSYQITLTAQNNAQPNSIGQSVLINAAQSCSGNGDPATGTLYVTQYFQAQMVSGLVYAFPGQASQNSATFQIQVQPGTYAAVKFQPCFETPPVAGCGDAGNTFTVSGPSVISLSNQYSYIITAPADAVPSSAAGPNARSAYSIPYVVCQSDSTGECLGGNSVNGTLGVYVEVSPPSTSQISISPNVGPIDVYAYNGWYDRSMTSPYFYTGTPWFYGCGPVLVSTPSNPNPTNSEPQRPCFLPALNSWRTQGATGITIMLPLCDSEFGTGMIENYDGTNGGPMIDYNWFGMFETLLQDLNTYGFTKLALRPSFGSAGQSGLHITTSTMGPPVGSCSGDPLAYYLNFMPTLPFPMVATPQYDKTGKEIDPLTIGYAAYSSKNAGYDCIPFNPDSFQGTNGNGNAYLPGPTGRSNSGNFVGWPMIFQAFNLLFQQMGPHGSRPKMNLDGFDLFPEHDIALGETVLMRLIFDNNHPQFSDAQANAAGFRTAGGTLITATGDNGTVGPSGVCPSFYSDGYSVITDHQGTDVLGWLRCLASAYGADPSIITMSGNSRLAVLDSQLDPAQPAYTPPSNGDISCHGAPTPVGSSFQWAPLSVTYSGTGIPCLNTPSAISPTGADCPGHYGDSSRADDGSMFVNALLGNSFGDSGDPSAGDGYVYMLPGGGQVNVVGRTTNQSGMYCMIDQSHYSAGCTSLTNSGCALQAAGPLHGTIGVDYRLPRVFDYHSYPCLLTNGCVSSDTYDTDPRDAHAVELTAREATTEYNAFYNVAVEYMPSILNNSPARLQISETHSPTPPQSTSFPYTCESIIGGGQAPGAVAWLSFLGLRLSNAPALPGGVTLRPIYDANNGWCLPGMLFFDFQDYGYNLNLP